MFSFMITIYQISSQDPRPEWVKTAVGKFHYLHFGGFSFAFTILVAVIIALLTEPIPKEKVCETVINYTVMLLFCKIYYSNS